jgi:hypothetical protein
MNDARDARKAVKDKDMAKADDQEQHKDKEKDKDKDKDKERGPSAREVKVIELDLGHRSGSATLRLAADRKRLHIELAADPKGLDKTGVNGLIDALKKVRDKMDR